MIDIERLRSDLINYFGAAMMYYPEAVIYISDVETASYDKLVAIALDNGFDLDDYKIKTR